MLQNFVLDPRTYIYDVNKNLLVSDPCLQNQKFVFDNPCIIQHPTIDLTLLLYKVKGFHPVPTGNYSYKF
jgi:hypothetical protein